MPTESIIELWPSVTVCVFATDALDNTLLTAHSMIDDNILDVSVDATPDDYICAPCRNNSFLIANTFHYQIV